MGLERKGEKQTEKSFVSYQNKKLLRREWKGVERRPEKKEVEFAHSFIRLTLKTVFRDRRGFSLYIIVIKIFFSSPFLCMRFFHTEQEAK